eukprot:tig00021439_g21488.t1
MRLSPKVPEPGLSVSLVLGRPTTGASPAGCASSFHDVQARSFTSAAALGGNDTQRHSEAYASVFYSF